MNNPSPQLSKCTCKEPVLIGWDRHVCALSITLDIYPITAAGEVAALRECKRTFALVRGQLKERDQWNIKGQIPSHDLIVIAEHKCGSFIESTHRLPKAPARHTFTESDQEIPF
jgi:hypothetical protein